MRPIDRAVLEYAAAVRHRASLVSHNASLRMRGRSEEQIPLPKMPPQPLEYEVNDEEGGYRGFTQAFTKADATKEFCDTLLLSLQSDDWTERLERGELPVGWKVRRWRRT